ncbi:accessory gene regulator B family protein [Clostridioides difficile]|uniref:accessory gene regulator ArgB-like protein n=2 Tax=Clostridioides difficile TaxID=1496 RepID=UPI00038D819D|nr:accessory gene regulator B family protein [Clostridioides difficile]OFU12070.1 accessory regulator [Clostridium sp. HMSC19C11]AYD22919.1 accessory regulator [Clostridioides difficile]EGT3705760.1 accessory regulator [Clostridioides difficile]EGT3781197.1 accessory regulator [Clostridioides difficile]EGT3811773.1 accessory regulator [Clostridioides difficile]
MFKRLSYKFANILVNNEIVESEDFEIYRYGFETLIYFIVNILVALFIGIIFDRFIHTVIFLSCYCTLRQFTGGYHARNYKECTLTFAVIYLITIFSANNIDINKYRYLLVLLMIISILTIYKLAPLEHRNKPLSESEKKHYRKTVQKILFVIICLIILCKILNIFQQYVIYAIISIYWIAILIYIGMKVNSDQ